MGNLYVQYMYMPRDGECAIKCKYLTVHVHGVVPREAGINSKANYMNHALNSK